MAKKITIKLSAEELRQKLNLKDGVDGKNGQKGDRGADGVSPDASKIAAEAQKATYNALLPKIPTIQQIVQELPQEGESVRDSLEMLTGEERLDASAIRGLPELKNEIKNITTGYGGLNLKVNNAKIGATKSIDFVGTGVAFSKVNGQETLTFTAPTDTNDKVGYDAGDPTPGYVADKFVAGTGITLSEGTGADENKLKITNSGVITESDPLSVHTNQTIPQTIINGIPLLDAEPEDFSTDHEFVNKVYVDTVIQEVVYVPDSFTEIVSDGITGDITYVQGLNDGLIMRIDEDNGAPGYDVTFQFSGIDSFTRLWVHYHYQGNHNPTFELWNYNTSSWNVILTLDASDDLLFFDFPITDTNYIDGSGNAIFRAHHSQSGSASHYLDIDYIALVRAGLGSANDHGALTGLLDDDHTQYWKDGVTRTGDYTTTGTGTFGTGGILGIDAATNTAGTLKFWSAGANDFYTTFTAGTQTADATYTLPTAMATANSQALLGSTAGVLSWGTNFGANNIFTTGTLGAGAITGTSFIVGAYTLDTEFGFLDGIGAYVYRAGGTDVAVADGGTNISSYAVGDLLYASGATTLSKLADVAAGKYLRSGGVGAAPLWSTLILPNAATQYQVVLATATNTYGGDAGLTYNTSTDTLAVTGSTLISGKAGVGMTSLLSGSIYSPSTPLIQQFQIQSSGEVSSFDDDVFGVYDADGNILTTIGNNGAQYWSISATGLPVGTIGYTTTTGYPGIQFKNDATFSNGLITEINHISSGGIEIKSGALGAILSKFILLGNGNVGIGTINPTANLQVTQPTQGIGTVSVSAGGTAWTGVGTQFLNTFKVGDTITSSGQTKTIATISSNTALTTNAVGAGISNKEYTLAGGTRFQVMGNGRVGINGVTPSSWLTLPAGTATAGTAPIKLTAGTDLTVVEAGTIEYSTALLKIRADDFGIISDSKGLILGAGSDAKLIFNGSGLVIQSDVVTSTDYLQLRGGTNGIDFNIGATEQISLIDGVLQPTTTNDIDLGTSSLIYKNAYINNYYAGSTPGIDSTHTVADGDGTNYHHYVFTKGILTSYTKDTNP